jgi:hypothetical protein
VIDAERTPRAASFLTAVLLTACGGGDGSGPVGIAAADAASGSDAGSQSDGGSVSDGTAPPDTMPQGRDAGGASDGPSSAPEAESGPQQVVGDCNSLPTAGTWQPITPPQVPLPGDKGTCVYGIENVVVDPVNLGTVYTGSCQYGIYKSTDCGSTWAHVNTGMNGNILDNSRQWTFIIDPQDPQVLYTNAGYNTLDGNHSGLFKTTDGGVDWQQIWPPSDGSLANVVTNNFVAQVNMDPTNHLHLLLGFHQVCAAPYTSVCFGETRDGGQTWVLHNADPRWGNSESQTPYLVNDQTWLFANHDTTSGLWVTSNGGQEWNMIAPNTAGHWPAFLYHAKSGYYIGTDNGMITSPDGVTWSTVTGYKGGVVTGLVGDGTHMWASNWGSLQPFQPAGTNPYMVASEADGMTWTSTTWSAPVMPDAQGSAYFTQGGTLGYDPAHHVLYSANGTEGILRVATQ